MANPESDGAPAAVADSVESRRAAVQNRLWAALSRASRELIYISLQRGGGEPFGAPFEPGLGTLTERVVRYFKQRSFFNFSSAERLRRHGERNKFTRHGAAPYHGVYTQMPAPQDSLGRVARMIRYLQDNRFFLFVGLQRRRGSTEAAPSPAQKAPTAPQTRR